MSMICSNNRIFLCLVCLSLLGPLIGSTPNGGLESLLTTPLLSAQPCTRLMTLSSFSTFASGCSSPVLDGGASGLLRLVSSEDNLSNLFSELSSSSSSSFSSFMYALILPSNLVTLSTLSAIRSQSGNIAGVLVLPPASPSNVYSPGFPFLFNPSGRGLINERWPFPIFTITDPNEAASLVAKATHNTLSSPPTYPQWAANFKLYMGPDDLTSETCLSSGSCLPLGGQSAWAVMSSLTEPLISKKPAVLACSSLDATSFFKGLSFGADASVSSLVALLVAAEALSREPSVPNLPFDILFAAFQAESFGRLGSRRFLANMENVTNRLIYTLAVDQVGLALTSKGFGKFFSHQYNTSSSKGDSLHVSATRSQFTEAIFSQLQVVPGIFSEVETNILPSTPLLSVTEFAPESGLLTLGEYNSTLISNVFQSEFDTFSNVDASSITSAALVIAKGLYALASNKSDVALAIASIPNTLAINSSLVLDFLGCITLNAQCTLFASLLGLDPSVLPVGPLALYTSVYQQPYLDSNGNTVITPSLLEAVTRASLAVYSSFNATANGTKSSLIPCSATTIDCVSVTGQPRAECIQGKCIVGNAYFHSALSLALESDGNGGFILFPGNASKGMAQGGSGDPLFTEPFWSSTIGVSIYQADAPWLGPTLLLVGVALTLATLGLSNRILVI